MRRRKYDRPAKTAGKAQTTDPQGSQDLAGCVDWVLAATRRCYEFAPNSYTYEAVNAAQAVAREIRKEST